MIRDNLPRPLPDSALAYLAALPPGNIVGFPLAALDRTGVPVWVVTLFLDESLGLVGAQPSGIGYGATEAQAILGALGEIAEAVFPLLASQNWNVTHGTYDALVASVGSASIVDPLTCCLPAGSPVGRATPLDWVPATRFGTGETVLLPIELAASDPIELPPGHHPFTTPITNGLGAGPDIDWAVGHGVLEILQRDGNGLVFRALDQGILLDPPVAPSPRAAALLELFADAGIRIYPKFATDEFGLTNLYVVGHDELGSGPRVPIMLSACGEACDPDRDRALVKAMTEFAAARVRKTFSHGPLADARLVAPPGYVNDFLRRAEASLELEESRALQAMLQWARTGVDRLRDQLAPSIYGVASQKPFESLPTTAVAPSGSGTAGRIAIDRLQAAGFDVLYVAMSPPGSAVTAVKVFVPRLEVETMSYYRIGERNVAKLLARDHPLIRHGKPTKTLRPVRLTEAAVARLGGEPPLFDTALADAIVGPLYPLYREPEAHHVAYRLGEVGEAGVSTTAVRLTTGSTRRLA